MNTKTVIMDFSGVYREENFYEGKDVRWLDFTKMSGVNCYCTPEAEAEIKTRIQDLEFSGIHFLDSGNYHYLSKFWIEKIEKPFSLVVFDHHTDMQEASFWGLLSCGSWVRECILSNKYMKEVCVIGPPEKAFLECEKEISEQVVPIDEEEIEQGNVQWYEFLKRNKKTPVYLSIDKDILSLGEARTNWDQGNVCFEKMKEWLHELFSQCFVLGADVCGEHTPDTASVSHQEDIDKNNIINRKLWRFLDKKFEEQEKERLDREFLETKQADKKLSIALLRYFDLEKEDKKKNLYGGYLKLRLRPAVELLIKKKENKKMQELIKEQGADENLVDSFLKTAVKYGNQEAQIFLLKEKENLGGFQEKSWEL